MTASNAELQRFKAVIEATSDLVAMATFEGRSIYFNQAALRLLKYSSDTDLSHIKMEEVYPADVNQFFREVAMPQAMRDGLWTGEIRMLAQTGEEIPVAFVGLVIKSVPTKAATAWAQFVATISQLEADETRRSAAKMLRLIMDAGYDDYLKETYDNYARRLDEIQQLAEFAFQFGTVEEFLTQLALLTNVEAEEDPQDDTEKIKLSTIHQAKGLEFEVVFVIMLCDGLFPSGRSLENDEGEEEERRLFYVAITRAKNELYLCYPLERASFSKSGGDGMQRPSRFLSEIPRDLLNEWNLRSHYA